MGLSDADRNALGYNLKLTNIFAADALHGAAKPRETIYSKYGKRFLDIVISGAAIVVTLPINGILAVLTYRDVGHPILFRQERAGKGGRPFILSKFRNMTDDRDDEGNLLPGDQRVTEFGKKVRATSLDELLNFWSIFKGDMSIIGPRPLLPEYVDRYCEYHKARLAVKPGLECPQREPLDHYPCWEEQFNNDVWYVENVSFRTDLQMFFRILEMAVNKKQMAERGSAKRSFFIGYGSDGRAISLNDID